MINVNGLTHHLTSSGQTLRILDDLNLYVPKGESVAIVGASGSGKSTLLGMLAGLDVPSAGSISINDHTITEMDEEGRANVRQQCVAFVFQNFQLLESLTAIENIALPMEIKGQQDAQQKAEAFLQKVGLAERANHYPRQLSGGEQQRVAIARAFACEAPVLFADEPTGNLDTKTGEKISQLLFEFNQQNGTTLVLVTHDQNLAKACDKQYQLTEGRLIQL